MFLFNKGNRGRGLSSPWTNMETFPAGLLWKCSISSETDVGKGGFRFIIRVVLRTGQSGTFTTHVWKGEAEHKKRLEGKLPSGLKLAPNKFLTDWCSGVVLCSRWPSFVTVFWENPNLFLCPAVTTSADKLQQRAACISDRKLQEVESHLYWAVGLLLTISRTQLLDYIIVPTHLQY